MTTATLTREVHPIYQFIYIGREREIISAEYGYEKEDMSDDWIALIGNGSEGSGVYKKFPHMPSMTDAEELFFSEECDWLRRLWFEKAYRGRDAELMVALRNGHRVNANAPASHFYHVERPERDYARWGATPLMTDDVRSRVLFTLGSCFIHELRSLIMDLAHRQKAIDADTLASIELGLSATRSLICALSDVRGDDASKYAKFASAQLDAQLQYMGQCSGVKTQASELLDRAARVLRKELRIHTEVTVECFAMPVKSSGVKAHASFSVLLVVLDALSTFIAQSRSRDGGLNEPNMRMLDETLHVMRLFVDMTNECLTGGDEHEEIARLHDRLKSLLEEDQSSVYKVPYECRAVVIGVYEAYCAALGLEAKRFAVSWPF